MSFREAHHVVGGVVREAIAQGLRANGIGPGGAAPATIASGDLAERVGGILSAEINPTIAAHRARRHNAAFLGSSGLIAALLVATAIGAHPYLLRSQPFPERSLTVANAAAASSGLVTAALWLLPGVVLILVYQVVVYRVFAGKVQIDAGAHY